MTSITPHPHAELLNCLVAMQETLLYAARKVTLREAEGVIVSLAAQVEALTAERDAIKQQAQIWKMEASTYKSTVQECYQACTGSTGEPGDWNGANPVRALVAERDALRVELDGLKQQEPVAWSVTVGNDYKNCIEITHCESDAVTQYEASTEGGFESIYTLHKLYAEAGAQPAEIEALRADAERYRWIRNNTSGKRDDRMRMAFDMPDPNPLGNIMQGSISQHLDAAIDAAKAASL